MEKCKRVESGEILLPEAIIHHIQSFMTGKEAAQTSVFSKHWYSAWSTRPNLDFNYRDFVNRGHIPGRFKDFVKKTIQRYEELNLTIDSIGLRANWWEKRRLSLYDEWVLKGMQMGATDFKLHLMHPLSSFSLPKELLGSENLVRLSAIGCTIDLGVNGKVSWSKLKSLSLHKVYFEGDVICDIILSCPLIEELLLSECVFKVHTSDYRRRKLAWSTNLFELRKLRCLSLKEVKIDTSFFCDFSLKFPCLKDLIVDNCHGYKAINISSPSLERISFVVKKKMLRVSFEVPCIRKFTFSGSDLPCLPCFYFGTSSSFVYKWESDISVTCSGNDYGHLTPLLWFDKMKRLLVDLSPSRISLTLGITVSDVFRDVIQGLSKVFKPPVVDNLRVLTGAPSLAVLSCLFWICRPKFISFTGVKADILELLCERSFGHMFDLKEVNMEFYDENLSEWGPALSLKALLDAYPENKQNIRFKLRWDD
ncbi:hypothetical protein CASFOL_026675 [Castilleja foliolosa]|uniref:F-box/LRR-repeat protein 15/At3g58940/PEG3-like LRR domain-containing protein n=1 Tax=Castilleja foliolosa TaxID=1961234 RepID=A0ABD3CHQ8_9LAMI